MSKAFVIKNKEGKYFESQCIANGEPRFYANQFLVFTNKDEAKAVLESIAEDCDYFNIACEVVEITIAEGDLEQELNLLKSIVKLDHPEIGEVKHFESGLTVILDKCVESKEQENKQLKEKISDYEKALNCELFINFKLPMEHTKLKREVEELKEQVAEQTDYKEEYYHYWQELKKELAIREKALELACEDIKGTGLFAITDEFESFEDNYIKNAEQKLNKDN